MTGYLDISLKSDTAIPTENQIMTYYTYIKD